MLRHLESFDALPSSGGNINTIMAAMGWYNTFPGAGTASTNTAFGVGKSLSIQWSSGNVLLGAHCTTVYFGVRCFIGWNSPGLSAASMSFQLIDAVPNAQQCSVSLGVNGVVRAYRGATELGHSDPGVFPQGAWFWLEAGIHIDSSAGSVEVRVNTVPVLSLVSQNTRGSSNTYCDSWGYGCDNNVNGVIDDVYVFDDTGSTNNTFAGNMKVQAQIPNGAGASTQFTPTGAASNWQAAANEIIDDTSYVASATAGQKDLYTLQPVVNAPLIYGVQVRGAMRQDDATQRTARTNIKNGSTLTNGTTKSLTQTYSATKDVYETNPATGTSFTSSDVNAMQAGPEVVS